MIQEELKNKEKDIKGITRQACSLLDTAWTKGYVAGFNDGYATRREADKEAYKRPHGKWIEGKNGTIMCSKCGCEIRFSYLVGNKPEFPKFCCDCGADMREAEE